MQSHNDKQVMATLVPEGKPYRQCFASLTETLIETRK
jgi:hypothetical protein